jgi:hypothetical protein
MRSSLVLSACACLMSAGVAAQQAGEDVLTSARLQMQARNLDSATALLRGKTQYSWLSLAVGDRGHPGPHGAGLRRGRALHASSGV